MGIFNSKKVLLVGLKGEKGDPGDSGVLKGTTAPTTETIGEIGKFYVDTTRGTSYQCVEVDTETPSYTWVKLIKETDIAQQNGDYGLVKLGTSNYGLIIAEGGRLATGGTSIAQVKGQNNGYAPISTELMALGVKEGLINPEISRKPAGWTNEERAMARKTLGILEGEGAPTTETVGTIGQFYTDTSTGTSYQCKSIVDGVYAWVKIVDKTELDKKIDIPSGLPVGYNTVIGYDKRSTVARAYSFGAYSIGADARGSMAQYNTNGRLVSATPETDYEVATKSYVDDAVANAGGGSGGAKSYLHTFTIYGDDTDVGITDAVVGEGYFYSTSQALDMVVLSGNTLSIDSDSLLTITSNIFVYDYTNAPIGTYTLEGTWYKDITSSYTLRRVVDVATEV